MTFRQHVDDEFDRMWEGRKKVIRRIKDKYFATKFEVQEGWRKKRNRTEELVRHHQENRRHRKQYSF